MAWSEWKNVGYTILEHIATHSRGIISAAGTSTYTYTATKSGLLDLRVMMGSQSGYSIGYQTVTVKKNGVTQTTYNTSNYYNNCSKEYDYSIEISVGDVITVVYGLTTWHSTLANDNHLVTVNLVS